MLKKIASSLSENGADAWVIYDFASQNPAFVSIFGKNFSTRKCFAVIDKAMNNTLICHSIDALGIGKAEVTKNFRLKVYNTWQQLDLLLEETLSDYDTVMMEISENGLMPRSSYVDYGTVCSVKRFVKNIISSADLFQALAATFFGESLEFHKKAAITVNAIKDEAFDLISRTVRQKGLVSEYEIQQFILKRFSDNGMVTDSAPIVAIEKNAASPHYEPTKDNHSFIRKGNMVLIDMWAKYDHPSAVFADITWMGFVGDSVPDKYRKPFETIKTAIDKALDFLGRELVLRKVSGYEVDDICNSYLKESGYGAYIVHRTGHSISVGDSDHGIGVNIDNFETHDTRSIINGVAFSLEPGIYTPEFRIREEINVYIENNKPCFYTKRQSDFIIL